MIVDKVLPQQERLPVEAPDGAQALPTAPDSKITSAITVGLPRESITSKPLISTILLMGVLSPLIALLNGSQTLNRLAKGFFKLTGFNQFAVQENFLLDHQSLSSAPKMAPANAKATH